MLAPGYNESFIDKTLKATIESIFRMDVEIHIFEDENMMKIVRMLARQNHRISLFGNEEAMKHPTEHTYWNFQSGSH